MNKLLLSNNGRNHIKMFPLYKNPEIPEDEGEKIKWCEEKFNKLQTSDAATRLFYYKNVREGVLISVWELDNLYYLINCIRNEFGTYNDTIYINDIKLDTLASAEFLKQNAIKLMDEYKIKLIQAQNGLQNEQREEHPE